MKHLTSQVRPAPAPTSPGESVAAPAGVGQVGGSIDSLLRIALSVRMQRGETLQQACSAIHREMVRLSLNHGLPVPAWPHDFAMVPAQGAEGGPLAGEASAPGAAINFGGQAQPCTPPVPVGNTGTTSTGQGV